MIHLIILGQFCLYIIPPFLEKDNMASLANKMSEGPVYGLDAELAAKAAAKRNSSLENQCLEWVQSVTKEPLPSKDLIEALRDGTALCKLINVVKPGTVKRVNQSKMAFKQRENITNFIRGCRTLGQSEFTLFTTTDLYERGNHTNVCNGLYAFGGLAQRLNPSLPKFGTRVAAKKQAMKHVVGAGSSLPSKLSMGGYGIQERRQLDTR